MLFQTTIIFSGDGCSLGISESPCTVIVLKNLCNNTRIAARNTVRAIEIAGFECGMNSWNFRKNYFCKHQICHKIVQSATAATIKYHSFFKRWL